MCEPMYVLYGCMCMYKQAPRPDKENKVQRSNDKASCAGDENHSH
jgi:hypothetical protein